MPNLYLIRHGKAAASWAAHKDPGLDELGREQAAGLVARLQDVQPLPILCSPLTRTRETAIPLSHHWKQTPVIEPRVAEIPSPNDDLRARSLWLRQAMSGSWSRLGSLHQEWRGELLRCLLEIPDNRVVISHFIAINAVVGKALQDDRLVVFSPDNCSITHVRTDAGRFYVESLGHELDTRVN